MDELAKNIIEVFRNFLHTYGLENAKALLLLIIPILFLFLLPRLLRPYERLINIPGQGERPLRAIAFREGTARRKIWQIYSNITGLRVWERVDSHGYIHYMSGKNEASAQEITGDPLKRINWSVYLDLRNVFRRKQVRVVRPPLKLLAEPEAPKTKEGTAPQADLTRVKVLTP